MMMKKTINKIILFFCNVPMKALAASLIILYTCLTAAAFAKTKPIEPELFDLLGDDLKIDTASNQNIPVDTMATDTKIANEPNAISVSPMPQSSQPIPVEENDPLPTNHPKTSPKRQLWKSRISSEPQNEKNQTKDELAQLIERIGAIKLEPQATKSQSTGITKEAIEHDSAVEITDAETTEPTDQKTMENAVHAGAISQQTLLMIQDSLAHPDQLKDPLGLGDLLYESGCLEDAAVCYQLALERISDDKTDPLENKPWILFQLGNCLQKENLDKSLEYYESIVRDYPESMWMPSAKAKTEWIQWQLQDKPEILTANVVAEAK